MEKGDKAKKKVANMKFFEFNEDGKILVPDDDKNNNAKAKLDSAKLKDEVEAFLRGGTRGVLHEATHFLQKFKMKTKTWTKNPKENENEKKWSKRL